MKKFIKVFFAFILFEESIFSTDFHALAHIYPSLFGRQFSSILCASLSTICILGCPIESAKRHIILYLYHWVPMAEQGDEIQFL